MLNPPPPYQPNDIGLLLTLNCNAACRHCCFECHPGRKERMTESQALGYIDDIGEIEGVESVGLTGGEVFTSYDLLCAVVRAAGAKGLAVRAVTNGYWASSPEKAREILLPLVQGGLTTINLSYDAFHEPYVHPDHVKHAVAASLEMGLEVAVAHTALGRTKPEDTQHIRDSLDLEADAPVPILLGHINPGGRADQCFALDELALADGRCGDGAGLHGPCRHVIREPVITPSGDLSACCGTAASTSAGFNPPFVAGSLNKRPLAELLEAMELDPVFTGLMVEGPWYFYERLEKQAPDLFERKTFVSICDLCAYMLCHTKARERLGDMIIRLEPRLMIKKMMLEAGRREALAAGEPSENGVAQEKCLTLKG